MRFTSLDFFDRVRREDRFVEYLVVEGVPFEHAHVRRFRSGIETTFPRVRHRRCLFVGVLVQGMSGFSRFFFRLSQRGASRAARATGSYFGSYF